MYRLDGVPRAHGREPFSHEIHPPHPAPHVWCTADEDAVSKVSQPFACMLRWASTHPCAWPRCGRFALLAPLDLKGLHALAEAGEGRGTPIALVLCACHKAEAEVVLSLLAQVLTRGRSAHVAHTLKSALMEDTMRARHARPVRDTSPGAFAPPAAVLTNQVPLSALTQRVTLALHTIWHGPQFKYLNDYN